MSFLADKLPRVNTACVTHTGDAGTYRSALADETVSVDIVLSDSSEFVEGDFAFERATSCMIKIDQFPWVPGQGDEITLLGATWLVDRWQIEHEMYLFDLRAPHVPE